MKQETKELIPGESLQEGDSPGINWGIIGCGDVTEVKSGPAFNKVAHSKLVAVMRRDEAKAKDYAERHGVPKYYTDAAQLINDPGINAIYIATPPGSHEEYAIAAINAGKHVYVEKPMALNYAAAKNIHQLAQQKNVQLTVAHYRNAQPFFKKIDELIKTNAIGHIKNVQLTFNRVALNEQDLADPKKAWRVDPAVSGGGLFHDMAPHQLGLMLFFFGKVKSANGTSQNTNPLYKADDKVKGAIEFENGVVFNGSWNFNATEHVDECIVKGSEGTVSFPIFGDHEMILTVKGREEKISFEIPAHVQQPMIAQTVLYFSGKANNPCTPEEGCEVMRLMELFTTKADRP